MLRGHWRVLAALAGLAAFATALGAGAFFGALYAPHYSDEAERSAYRRAQAEKGNPSQIDRDRAGLPDLAERIAAGPDPQNTDESQKRDLAAQEASALWAFWLLVISAIGAVTTIIGTGFLLWQIVLTRRAVLDTGKATKAMERQNDLADQAQRPWLEIDTKFHFITKTSTGFILSVTVVLKNIGKMPAYQAKIDHVLYLAAMNPIYAFREAAEIPRDESREYQSDLIVLPGGIAEDQELIFLDKEDPRHPIDDAVFPQFMITVHYELPDGRSAQSSAWFSASKPSNTERQSLIRWEWEPDDTALLVESHGYIRVT